MGLAADALHRCEKNLTVGRIHSNAADKWTSGAGALWSNNARRARCHIHERVVFRPASAAIVRNQNAGAVKTVEREIFLARAVIDRAGMSACAVAYHGIDREGAA